MIKYAANAFLATKITFINEIAALCEKVGADVNQVSKAWAWTRASAVAFCKQVPAMADRAFPKTPKRWRASVRNTAVPMQITETVITRQ